MDGRGRTHDGAANEIDKAKRSFEDLTMKNSDADVIHNNLDDIESTIQDIKHLIESTRSLLDRVPLSKNAQNFKKSDLVEPHVEPHVDAAWRFRHSVIHMSHVTHLFRTRHVRSAQIKTDAAEENEDDVVIDR